jgi:penicillin amidase
MALAFTGLGDHDLTAEALMHLNSAKNWDDFTKALTLYQTPPQNVVYADIAGNIGFYNPGLAPVRKKGQGLVPVGGASGDYDWVGMIPFTWLPHLYNPAAGFIFNANNSVASADLPYFMGMDWEEPYRAERLQQFFDTLPKHSLATSAMMQADHLSLAARDLLPYLRNLTPDDDQTREAVEMLKHWDGVMDKDKPEPLIFEAWLYQMHKIMLVGKAHDPLTEKGPFDASSLVYILSQYPEDWCSGADGKPTSDCSGVIAKALKDALAMLDSREKGAMKDWKWGNEHITLLQNKVFSHVPFIGARVDLSIPSSGDFYTLDRGGSFTFDHKHPFARTHGGGYRGLYDLADPDQSRFMIATGESGHILSPHYGDLAPLWNDVKSFTLAGAPKDLVARNLPELVLQPAR